MSISQRVGMVGVASVLIWLASPVSALAQAELEYSEPADGDEVAGPLVELVIAFASPVTLVGFGFEVVDPEGNVLVPEVESDDDTVFTLTFDPPMGIGEVVVHYEVTSEGEVASGSIAFTIGESGPSSPTTSIDRATTLAGGADTAPASGATPEPADVETEDVPVASDDDGDGATGTILLAVVAAMALGAGVFVLVRSNQ